MIEVSFEEWMETLRRAADREGMELKASDHAHRVFYDNNDTPLGALIMIQEFGY